MSYSSYPYPYPMQVLPALLYTLGKEMQATYGRATTEVAEDWLYEPSGLDETVLRVRSTLGFPVGGGYLQCSGYTLPLGSMAMTEDTFILSAAALAAYLPPGVMLRAGSRVTLKVAP